MMTPFESLVLEGVVVVAAAWLTIFTLTTVQREAVLLEALL